MISLVLIVIILCFGFVDRQQRDPVALTLHEHLFAHRSTSAQTAICPERRLGLVSVRTTVSSTYTTSHSTSWRSSPKKKLRLGTRTRQSTIDCEQTTKGRTRVLTDEGFESIKVPLRDMTVFKSDKYRATPQAAFRQDAADIVELLSGTGARRAEVTTLEWPQINLKTKTIHLYRSKTDNEMVFHMTDDAYEVLVRRSESKRHPLYVFPNRKGNGPRRSPGSSIKKAIKRAGLGPEVTPHVFRHSVATKLLNGGMPITQVQYFLGHKDPMTTHRYLHTSKQASSVAAAAILSRA